MQPKKNFQFVDTDLLLLRDTYELRLASIDHLAALSERSYKRTADRLAALASNGYLKCVTRRPQKLAYGIGHAGIALLVEHGHAPREVVDRRLRQHELKELGIRHALFVAGIHARILQLTRPNFFMLSTWVEGPALWDRVTTSSNITLPIRPDALFTMAWPAGNRKAHFFLVADRGTMAHSRMRDKVTGYAAYFQQQRHVKKYPGMKSFRVVTVTESRGRADSLAAEFRSMMPAAWVAAYPVIAFEDLTITALLPELVKV